MAESGIGAVCARLNAMENKWRAGLESAISEASRLALAEARGRAPVDTGALRRSLSGNAQGLSAVVSAGVGYAAYVELGTGGERGHPAQPYLRPAFEIAAAELLRRAREVVV